MTAEHIQRACDLLNAERGLGASWFPERDGNNVSVKVLARQLALADAEAERVRKVAEEIVRLLDTFQVANHYAEGKRSEAHELAKSLLPPEPVDELVDIVLKAKISAGVSAAYCAQLLHEAAAKQGKVIKIEGRP